MKNSKKLYKKVLLGMFAFASFSAFAQETPKEEDFSKIELFGSQKAPYIELNFSGKNKEKASDMVLFDTGMDGLYDMSKRAFTVFEKQNIFEIKGESEGLSSVGLFGLGNPSLQRLLSLENTFLNNKSNLE